MLETRRLTMSFGGVHALNGVSYKAQPGVITGLIGANGAGKSTFINCVTGVLKPTAGAVFWQGNDLTNLTVQARAAIGIARTFQHARLFSELTVLENVMVGAHQLGRSGFVGAMVRSRSCRHDERRLTAASYEALAAVHADHLASARAEDLTAGQQRLVAIARALVSKPRMLLLDEPAAGLTDYERETLLKDLQAHFLQNDVSALVVEHNLGFLMPLVSHLVVLEQGSLLAEGTPSEIRSDPAVVEAYLGEQHADSK